MILGSILVLSADAGAIKFKQGKNAPGKRNKAGLTTNVSRLIAKHKAKKTNHILRNKLKRNPERWSVLEKRSFFSAEALSHLGLSKEYGGIKRSEFHGVSKLSVYRPSKKDSVEGFEVTRYVAKIDRKNPANVESDESRKRDFNKEFLTNLEIIMKESLYEIDINDVYDSVESFMLLPNPAGNVRDTLSTLTVATASGLYDKYFRIIPNLDIQKSQSKGVYKSPLPDSALSGSFETENGKLLAYVRYNQFGQGSATQIESLLSAAITKVEDTGPRQAEGIILDLTGNPGGSLHEAQEVIKMFAEKTGHYFSVQGKANKNGDLEEVTKFSVDKKGKYADVPLVILIDEGSASASELVAGALQNKNGNKTRVIGNQSYGKAIGQSGTLLPTGDMLITTKIKLVLSGKEKSYNRKGIAPDVTIDPTAMKIDPRNDEAVGALYTKVAIEEVEKMIDENK